MLKHIALSALFLPLVAVTAQGLTVMTSGGFAAPYKVLAQQYEVAQHLTIATVTASSAAAVPGSIPTRLAAGEPADVVIMARADLDALVAKHLIVAGSQVDLATSRIAMAVRAGTPPPDIHTVAALRQTLLRATSVGYSGSASGLYIKNEMYKGMGIEEELAPKSRAIVTEPVGDALARGAIEIGFQQMSELKPVKGITIVGLLPDEVQRVTSFSAGIVAASQHKGEAAALIRSLSASTACGVITESALDPVACPQPAH